MDALTPKQLELLERRKRIARLYLQGKTQWEIARVIGQTQGEVSRDLAALRKLWLDSSLRDFDAAKAEQLAKIDALEAEYWKAWRASCKQREISSSEKRSAGGKLQTKAGRRIEKRDGNPTFLAGVQWCINKRCEILGLNAPMKVAPTDPDGNEQYTGSTAGGVQSLLAELWAAVDASPEGEGQGRSLPPADSPSPLEPPAGTTDGSAQEPG